MRRERRHGGVDGEGPQSEDVMRMYGKEEDCPGRQRGRRKCKARVAVIRWY